MNPIIRSDTPNSGASATAASPLAYRSRISMTRAAVATIDALQLARRVRLWFLRRPFVRQ